METLSLSESHHAGFFQRDYFLEIVSLHGCRLGHQLILALLFRFLFSPVSSLRLFPRCGRPPSRDLSTLNSVLQRARSVLTNQATVPPKPPFTRKVFERVAGHEAFCFPLVLTVPGSPWLNNIFIFRVPLLYIIFTFFFC
jgi:hypothetical protein